MTRWFRLLLAIAALVSIAATSAQGPDVDRLMRKKLVCAQKILEAVVTSRWSNLGAETRAMEMLTDDPAWHALTAPEYAHYSSAFRKTLRDLHDAAEQRDLDAAPKAYAAMTLACVECHRYLARSRIAGR